MDMEKYRVKHILSKNRITARQSMVIQQIRKLHNRILTVMAKEIECSIFSSDCVGGCILHDIGKRFNSPTVNLWFEPNDFIKFLSNLEFYFSANLVENRDYVLPYPVATLFDINIYFTHYSSFEVAEKHWYDRCKRVQWNNIYVIMDDHGLQTNEQKIAIIEEFNLLSYSKKVFFTNSRDLKELPNVFYVHGFDDQKCVGNLMYFQNRLGVKYYDQFDYIKWLTE